MKNTWQRKDYKRRRRVDESQELRVVRKAKAHDERRSRKERMDSLKALRERPRDGSRTRVNNRCVETGRGRSVRSQYRRSRFVVRERALQGRLPGVRKVSW